MKALERILFAAALCALLAASTADPIGSEPESGFDRGILALFRAGANPILVINPSDGSIVDANEQALEYYGYPDLVGMKIFQINTLTADEIRGEMRRAMEGSSRVFNFKHRLADGSIRDVRVLSTPFRTKEGEMLLSLVFDETERLAAQEAIRQKNLWIVLTVLVALVLQTALMLRMVRSNALRKKAESALQEKERTFTALFSGMSEVVALHRFVFDDEGRRVDYRLIECNAAYERVIGLPAASVTGRLATEIYGGEAPYLAEYSEVAETGVPKVMEVFYPPLEKHFLISIVSSAKDRFATITTDITEMKRVESRLRAKRKELEQIVYAASHDLRSPLVNVEGYSRELEYSIESLEAAFDSNGSCEKREAAARSLLPDMKDSLRRIRSGARQMDSLLAGLLKLSRLRKAALNLRQLDMNAIVSELVSSMRFQVEKSGATISVGDLPRCYGDAVQITQVFSNLLNNALKYLDPARPGVVRIEGSRTPDRSVYSVVDNGIGIAPEHQEKVFELFHRLNPSEGAGDGLGLTIVRQILWMLGGDVSLESKFGEGSAFKVSMPAAPPEREVHE